jgi:hypothetical protein
LPAQAVHEHFANRPALFSVVFNALRERILERYPALDLDLLNVKLASPSPSGGWTLQPLMSVAINHVLNPAPLYWSPRRELPFYLTQKLPSVLDTPNPPHIDMQVIAQIIDELPSTIHIYFQQALADYWSEVDAQGISRWQWLGEFLNGQMTAAAASRPDLTQTQRDMLTVVSAWPQRLQRLPRSVPTTYVYFIETTFISAEKEQRLLTPDLLLVRDKDVLLFGVAGAIESFDSIDAFEEAWGGRMQRRFRFDSITVKRNEPDGNVFEQQAGLILNQQLEDLGTLTFQGHSEIALERRLEKLTDPALLFSNAPEADPARLQQVNSQLPTWIKQANADDRFAYHRHLQDMALLLQQNQGRSFNEGIENIHSFSRDALRKQMQTDHASHDPDDVVLDFAVAAGYPGGAGIIDHVRMSLTELALKNLAGKPKGTLTLSSKSGKTLPQWLDEAYLLGRDGLIQRVDIGTTYPQKIKELLLSDTVDARRRETLFARELKVRLPMQALEYKIRNLHGVCLKGYRYVKALMGETFTDRFVDDQEIVLRPLALCRTPGVAPDEVNNMFIIEPRDPQVGPHLLYRPLYDDSLQQYPTRQALLDALATPGELQNSVLTWLADKARPIYDHGGIKEPHIIHFLRGDEFTLYEKPAPATLTVDEGAEEWLQSQVDGQLPQHLFGSTARALVDLADRESVSNGESRWAIVMEGAWLLFNTLLLPLARGPAMLAGWLVVLVSSLEQDLAGLDSDDPTTRELALIDLLLNTATVLLHAATPSNRSRQPLVEPAPEDTALHLTSWHRPAGGPDPQGTPIVLHGTVALPGEPPAAGHSTLDFSRSIASPKASAKLLNALLAVHVPWPDTLPSPEASGPLQGLYRMGDLWHASVGGLLFQVSVEPGFGEVYLVDPKHPDHPGFKLASDGQGHWRLDRKVRLRGGMPKKRVETYDVGNQSHLNALKTELRQIWGVAEPLFSSSINTQDELYLANNHLNTQITNLNKLWLLRSRAIPELMEQLAARHEQQRLDTLQAKVQWDIAFEKFYNDWLALEPVARKLVDKNTELMTADRTNEAYRKHRDQLVLQITVKWEVTDDFLAQEREYVKSSERGESYSELQDRANAELDEDITTAYEEIINSIKKQYEILKKQDKPTKEIERILEQADHIQRKSLVDFSPGVINKSTVTLKQYRLLLLVELVLDRSRHCQEPSESHFVDQLHNMQLYRSILSHVQMRSSSGYSTAEQIAVLKDVLKHYGRMENAINSLTDMGSGFVRDEYRTPFLDQLSDARTSLEAQLADLILIDEGFAPAPVPDKPVRAKPPTRKVFKTRNKESLVGDLRPPEPGDPGSLVDIKDPNTGATVATYLEHADEGVWVEVVPARPAAPVSAPMVRSLESIKQQANSIIAQRPGIERTIRAQQKKLKDPSRREDLTPLDWNDMLIQHADKLNALVEEIRRDHSTDPAAVRLGETYLDEANAATALARQVCSEGYKQQLPKAVNIAYLWKYGFVDINLVRSRVSIKTGDYLTEYVVRESNTMTVLWYAHFHYVAVDTPASQYSFGHLKLPAQRYLTRKQLIERAIADNRAVVNLNKSVIARPLAEQLFLGLEPPLPDTD